MAVPKKRTSHSKKRMRSSTKFIRPQTYYHDDMGVPCLPHRIDSEGKYNGKQIIIKKVKKKEESSE
jgi:ribosomal protein L32